MWPILWDANKWKYKTDIHKNTMQLIIRNKKTKVVLPENSFKNICYCKGWLCKHYNQNHMRPCILAKLILVHLLLQCKNEPHKTWLTKRSNIQFFTQIMQRKTRQNHKYTVYCTSSSMKRTEKALRIGHQVPFHQMESITYRKM